MEERRNLQKLYERLEDQLTALVDAREKGHYLEHSRALLGAYKTSVVIDFNTTHGELGFEQDQRCDELVKRTIALYEAKIGRLENLEYETRRN